MLTIPSILCPVDFSDHSRVALRWATALAARHHSRLVAITAVEPLLAQVARMRFGLDLAHAETVPALREFVRASVPPAASWAPTIDVDVRVSEPADLVLETAAREKAALIVMGSHGLGGLRKLLLGSTTELVLRRAQTPVLVVPLSEPPVVFEEGGPRFDAKPIVAATDFSAAAGDAIECAATLAQEFSAPLVLLHAVPPLTVPSEYRSYVEGVDEEHLSQARGRLEGTIVPALRDRASADIVVALGRPAESITSIAKERGAGLIVMGLTGRQGAMAPRPGSIAYRVLSESHVPVLVVPARADVKPDEGRGIR